MQNQKAAAPTVYIVDDDDAMLDSLSSFLQAHGLSTRCWNDAARFLNDFDPDMRGCLLLDLRMPSMSGLDLQEGLLAVGSALPIIFLTGHADVVTAVQALKAGAFHFLEKPYDNAALLTHIQQAFTLNEQTHQAQEQRQEIRERLRSLTPREAEVLDYIVNGKATKVIAIELQLSQRTVEIYRANVMQKMQTKSLASLVKMVGELRADASPGH